LGRPSTSRDNIHVGQVHEIMHSNHRLTVPKTAEECNISIRSCHDILTTKLEMHWVVAKFVPQLLTQDQRDNHVTICQEPLDCASKDENFLKTIITGSEAWICGYSMEIKMQSSLWVGKYRRDQKRCGIRWNVKVIWTFFFQQGCCAS
jgi:hypothetical protein